MSKEIKALCELKNCDPEDGLALVEVLNIFSGKWKMIIIGSMFDEDIRFSEIQKLLPSITPRMLSKELKELEQHQLIKRVVIDQYPIKISYSLEPYADSLTPIIYAMKDWGLSHKDKIFNKWEKEEL